MVNPQNNEHTNGYWFKPLHFNVVCYEAKDNCYDMQIWYLSRERSRNMHTKFYTV